MRLGKHARRKLFAFVVLIFPHVALAENSACSGLKVLDCFSKKGCVLDCTERDKPYRCSPYVCRDAVAPCETRYPQNELRKENCEEVARCKYSQPFCFCPGPMACACGGGPPAMCKTGNEQ